MSSRGKRDAASKSGASVHPATDELTIRSLRSAQDDLQTLRLFDALGRLALEQTMTGPLIRLDVHHLHGFFSVVLDHGSARLVGRVLIN